MVAFYDFLRKRLSRGGFSTEDALAAALPLIRETLDAHFAGSVAPLQGLDALQVEGSRIWFGEARRQAPMRNDPAIAEVEMVTRAAVDVVAETQRTTDLDDGRRQIVDMQIGRLDIPAQRPVYLPGYVAWEHTLQHHDPLTDVFSLGMILASLACGLDFHRPGDLHRFVENRKNLFTLQEHLHPVLARAIVRMTEIDRHRRPQDLPAILRTLEHYRDQDIDFEYELARIQGFERKDKRTKQTVVLEKLRERLFEISRRNRLLHFRPTMRTVNLSHASVPLSLDVRNIRPGQILVWNDETQREFLSGRSVSLNKRLNFAEALYLPPVLDRIQAESRRDAAEFGFAQLRLAVCFLHWANLKEEPYEQYDSPLVLLPVRLEKRKGIRDTYTLAVLSTEAEVNPVVRHLFQQLYGIDLPELIDLSKTSLLEFYDYLRQRIQASDPAVALELVDRPRIALIHEKAKRKLDQYRRRARLTGRGVRTYLDLDYSYDPANYNPLGIKLFASRVRSPETRLRRIIEENPRPRAFAVPPGEAPVAQKEHAYHQLQPASEDNPYTWAFDLCNVTLANFRYRRMSLVRDYEELLGNGSTSPCFEAVFSLTPRPTGDQPPSAPPLESRFDVVPCDPTQATAIAEARRGDSYIIQGPPGTGKSQTITNLIADFVALGKRVLFVCEKRAAIDVVYARLRQCGLGDLCCLIHDSQTDKKAFVMELKQTYESFLGEADSSSAPDGQSRDELLESIARELEPLEAFDAAMLRQPPNAGVSVRELLSRCIALQEHRPELTSLERERLPQFAEWEANQERIQQYEAALREIQPNGVLRDHPLRRLSVKLAGVDRPLEMLIQALGEARSRLRQVIRLLEKSKLPCSSALTVEEVRALAEYAVGVQPIARAGQMELLDETSDRFRPFSLAVRRLREKRHALQAAREANHLWRQKPPAAEVTIALQQARAMQGSPLAWLKPAWWRLRSTLNRVYDFDGHIVRPTWVQVLTNLENEYALLDEWHEQCERMATQYGIDGDVETWVDTCMAVRNCLSELPPWLYELHRALVKSPSSGQTVQQLINAGRVTKSLVEGLEAVLDDSEHGSLESLQDELASIAGALDDLPAMLQCLADLAHMPEMIRQSLRTLPFPPVQIEAAVADRTLEEIYIEDRTLARFSATTRRHHAQRLEQLYHQWLDSNAREVRQRVKRRFLKHVHAANLPAAQLDADQREFKKTYNRGRRQLEHEFGKSMRYRPIRELVTGETGEVVRDLKPVWLMSPLSVADTLPLATDAFDVVIFDEASQITLEEAVPCLFRSVQAIVVGDEMQLPPTDFFSARKGDEEELWFEEGDEVVQYDLESNSFLNHSAKNLASTMLGWHYRSRSESLISFSNWMFYDGRLLTVPEEQLPVPGDDGLLVEDPAQAENFVQPLLERAISFHLMKHGVYEKRRNRVEADYIAGLVRGLLREGRGLSIGVVAFSEAQQDEIENALQRLANKDEEFRSLLDAELEREEDGQFVGLLVKNLENIQGDERDVIILSVCYGYGPAGKMLMNFGPINRSGGEKRLNVAFSRAKHHMVVVSSIQYSDITNEYNDGANCLRNYLRYADATSRGNSDEAELILHGMQRWRESGHETSDNEIDPLATALAAALTERGYLVAHDVGQSHFRCDLAVRRPQDRIYRLGILLDGRRYYEPDDMLERDMMRPRLLQVFGWRITHVLAKDWYADRERILERLISQIESESDERDADQDGVTGADRAEADDSREPSGNAATPDTGEQNRADLEQ